MRILYTFVQRFATVLEHLTDVHLSSFVTREILLLGHSRGQSTRFACVSYTVRRLLPYNTIAATMADLSLHYIGRSPSRLDVARPLPLDTREAAKSSPRRRRR